MAETENQQSEKAIGADDDGYRVLARKYRPRTFEDLIGQEAMVQTLSNAFETGRIAQAYMLTGVRGVGKTTTARLIARALNYKTADGADGPTIAMTELGENCEAIMASRHVDVLEMDAASNTGIDDIREIIESVRYRPVSARYKVYIIDEVHMLSKAAFNGLLKTLEEPPPHVKFIFATTEVRKVPVTVLSRCQRFDLRRVEASVLIDHFASIAGQEGAKVETDALAQIARASEGSVRDGLSLLDQAIAHGVGDVTGDQVRAMLGLVDRARVIDMFEQVMRGDIASALGGLKEQYIAGADPGVVLADMAELVHWITRLRLVPEAAKDPTMSEAEAGRGVELAEKLSMRVLSRAWQMLLKGISEVDSAPNALAAADMVLVRMAHAADLPTVDEAIRAAQSAGAQSGGNGAGRAAQAAPEPQASPAASASAPAAGSVAESSPPAGQQSGETTMRSLAQTAPAPASADIMSVLPEPQLESFEDVVALVATKRDLRLKNALMRFVRLVSFKPGHIEIRLEDNAHGGLANELGRKLGQWTGERWIITVSGEQGGKTLAEQAHEVEERKKGEAAADPLVQAVLAKFPNAKIKTVTDLDDMVMDGEIPGLESAPPPDDPDDPFNFEDYDNDI